MKAVLKRYCKDYAEWRLLPGKVPERLAAHYRLSCDYRTGIMVCWEKGGTEPINLCENHAKSLTPARDLSAGDHIMAPRPSHANPAAKAEPQVAPAPAELRAGPEQVVSAKPSV